MPVRDDEPLLFHTGLKGMFPAVREAVAGVLDPARIRWTGFSNFESDECGSLPRLVSPRQALRDLNGALRGSFGGG